jgi:hypothetical protein
MEPTVRTLSVVPAGIVAAPEDEAAKEETIIAITAMNLFCIILV